MGDSRYVSGMRVAVSEMIRKSSGFRFPRLGRQAYDLFFQLMPRRATVELFEGINVPLNFNDDTQRTTYWQGERFEFPTADILKSWGKRSTCFFDIGSNYGFFSFLMLARCPELEVYSFEPNPETFALVQSAKDSNALERMHPYNLGLGEESKKLDLFKGVVDSGHSTFGKHPELIGQAPFNSIQVVRFDDFIIEKSLGLPSSPAWCAKIDVEGFELKVLRGMRSALAAKAFLGLVVEINPFTLNLCQATAAEIFDLLESHGYRACPQGITRATMTSSGNAFFELKP